MDAHLLEDAARHQAHLAAAAMRAGGVGTLPGRAQEGAGSSRLRIEGAGGRALDRLEARTDAVAQAAEPGAGLAPAGLEHVGIGQGRG